MTEETFCKLYTSFYGEPIDKVKQLTLHAMNGEELMEFVNYCLDKVTSLPVKARNVNEASK